METCFDAVDQAIQADIRSGFPGVGLLVWHQGQLKHRKAYGFAKKYDAAASYSQSTPAPYQGCDDLFLLPQPVPSPQAMTEQTLFDLASNTKIYATTYALLHLWHRAELRLDDPVCRFLHDFIHPQITLLHLLQHSSGLPADIPFHDPLAAGDRFSQHAKEVQQMLLRLPLTAPTATRALYSDLGFMLLGIIVEQISGIALDTFVEREIFQPLGLTRTCFNPLQKGFFIADCAATEIIGNSRDRTRNFPHMRWHTVQGEVLDEKCFYCLNGVAGHAGLFSTLDNLSVLLQLALTGGSHPHFQLCREEQMAVFMQSTAVTDATFACGWRKNSGKQLQRWFGGAASEQAIGHTGWTGCITLLDPPHQLAIALLTNSKHSPIVTHHPPPAYYGASVSAGNRLDCGRYGPILSLIYQALEIQ